MKKTGNKIKKIHSINQNYFSVELEFLDGSKGMVSLRHLFETPKGLAAEILRGGIFNKCFVEMGALAWPNGFELCPDALKEWLRDQRQHSHQKAA